MAQHYPLRPTSGASDAELAAELRQARERTLRLTGHLGAAELMGPVLPFVNPIQWELGHIAWFHEYWTLRHAHGAAPLIERCDRLWDSSNVTHASRWHLDLPDRAGTLAFMNNVLARQLDHLDAGLAVPARYFYELGIRHEDMHVEALAYMHQTLAFAEPPSGIRANPCTTGAWPGDVEIPGGEWQLGSGETEGFVFDNEKWRHPVDLQPFRIARAPVTNAQFADFVEEGGYRRREFWCEDGWRWRAAANAERPVYWYEKRNGVWTHRHYREIVALAADAPVIFVSWYEASAWCRWAGRRLPTEAEWEAAACGMATAIGRLASSRRRWPWGDAAPSPTRANLDFAYAAPVDVAACPEGDSAFGCRQMIGNVWEWTASDFLPFGGFSPDPYQDYSQPWFGTRKVLRGGCWASSARIARPAYRNFFTPDRCDVFAGFRTCALRDEAKTT